MAKKYCYAVKNQNKFLGKFKTIFDCIWGFMFQTQKLK